MFDNTLFSQRLKKLRTDHNLTLDALGKEIGCTRATLGNLENKNKNPSIDMLILLCNYFDVSMDYLVGLSDKK